MGYTPTVPPKPIVVLFALLFAFQASAQPPAAKKEAGVHYKRGVDFYKENNFSAALAEFKAAYQAAPSFEVLFNIGLSERRLFKYGQALRTLNKYLEDGAEKVPKDRRAAVAQEIELIRSLTAPIAVIVNGPPANVHLDGELIATTPLTEMLLIAPGKHVLRAEREGDVPEEKPLEVVSGVSQAVTFELKSLKAPVAVAVETTPPGAQLSADGAPGVATPTTLSLVPGTHELVARLDGYQPARIEIIVSPGQPRSAKITLMAAPVVRAVAPPRKFPVVGAAFLGGGLLLGGAGAYFAVQAQSYGKQMTDLTRSGATWDPSLKTVQENGQRAQLDAQVLIGAGTAAVLAGLVLGGVSLLGAPDAAETPVVVVVPTLGGGSVACAVSF